MFERYTEKARRCIFFAGYEAKNRSSRYIEPDHIFLGILREDPVLICRFLVNGVSWNNLFEMAGQIVPALNEPAFAAGDRPLTKDSKDLMVKAAQIAGGTGAKFIGPEHLLLSCLEQSQNLTPLLVTKLAEVGISLEVVRKSVVESKSAAAKSSPTLSSSVRINEVKAMLLNRLAAKLPADLASLPFDLLKEMITNGECTQTEADLISYGL